MAKKATFKTVPGPAPEPEVDVVDKVDDVDTLDTAGDIEEEVGALLVVDLEAQAAEDYEGLLQVAKELQSRLKEVSIRLDVEQRENDALMEALADSPREQALTPVAGVVDVSLGAGPILQVPVYLKKPWARQVDVAVGGCIGYAVLRAGVDLNLFVDSVRSGLASDTPPAR